MSAPKCNCGAEVSSSNFTKLIIDPFTSASIKVTDEIVGDHTLCNITE